MHRGLFCLPLDLNGLVAGAFRRSRERARFRVAPQGREWYTMNHGTKKAMALTIHNKVIGAIPCLELIGRVTDDDARELSTGLRSLCRQGHPIIGVDISKVQFVDSHGLGVFVFYSTLMEKANRRLVFVHTNRTPTSYVNRLFQMTNLDKVLDIAPSLQSLA